ncbi:MAG: hydrogenase nickel incorporation protein HypB [candidate division Zixibacteria bacterium]|nr:hydrogenase nickel incorporation protein HypB [candidate division Zixibacteria bacterium]MBU1469889.1 hydrogenase nickel incorporation protein HypB [candidate division Zixibacteria bacterium]MBU2623984.1 hydrogenase nickel incorporation protein HypB [candidate division Zixibacteria bacterium]
MNEKISIEKKILSENDRLAVLIREGLSERQIVSLNLVSSPGSGKTSLLEKTLGTLNDELRIAVFAGDVQTEHDAERLRRAGGRTVKPIITGGACHLDARMVIQALDQLDLRNIDLLFIENVGNLVCPASYDLGEEMKVVLISTTEGDDKPLKYPAMFRRSSALVINKTDLLGLSDFDVRQARENALRINGNLNTFEISCKTDEGLELWYDWLRKLVARKRQTVPNG